MNSYVHGASDTPLLGDTLGACLDRAAAAHPAVDAVVFRPGGLRLDYAALHAAAMRLARSFLAIGVRPGDRIAICSHSCAEWVIVQYATAKIGAVLVPLNPAYRAHEFLYAIDHVGATVVLLSHRVAENVAALMDGGAIPGSQQTPSPGKVLSATIVALDGEAAGRVSWKDLLARADERSDSEVEELQRAIDLDDPAMILYTSGTTGRPKGVVLSHHNVTNGGFFVGRHLHYTERDRICQPLPLYHILGCVAAHVAALTHGCTIVLPSEVFDARRCLDAIEDEQCTALYGVPTMFIAMLEHPAFQHGRVASLRTGVISGAACPRPVMARIVNDLHLPEATVGYGLTEMAPILYTAVDDSLEDRTSTAGKVQPHVECKIVDPQTKRIVPRGTAGELCARGYCRMRGYWNDSDATASVIDEDGWVHSGDLTVMREDGYVSIVGRIKDIVIRGGENVSPREVEDLLHAHPKVQEAQIVGIPDREYGEEICAWIRLRPGEQVSREELRAFCRRHLAAHKIPRYIYFTDQFPKTSSGKVQKYRLREQALEHLSMSTVDVQGGVHESV